ncbi:MAG TPA: carbamoyltransferase C-terminal domain-containing protein [Kofleriaceae bacterium]|nr:carbamoyltransferase C-terminal domain-containing protein [Kofleriaceae bacterium]
MRYFLAFSYNLHDSSVSIADEERVLLVLEAERYFGEKKKRCDRGEMEQLIAVALAHCGIGIHQVEGVACTSYRNEHLAEDSRDFKWLAERRVEVAGRSFEALVLNHHLAHAAIVYAYPGARDVVIDVCDGGGDFGDSHFIYRCRIRRIEQLPNRPVHDAFSSRFYDVMSRYLYKRRLCEGKMMALASLGQPRADMMGFIRDHLAMFHTAPPDQTCAEIARRYPVDDYVASQNAYDLAASVQRVFEELRVQSVAELPSDAPEVLLAGGATLNILANTRVREHLGAGRHLLVPPVADDSGQSLGALLYYCHERMNLPVTATMPFIGYSDSIDDSVLAADDAGDELVSFLQDGGIVFLHRGQSEIGPRALGHRSILAIPTPRSYDLINHVIKLREFYRPVAPLVPRDQVSDWFDWEGESRYMLYAAQAREKTRLAAAGICHYDNTARLQTVDGGEDPFLHALLTRVGQANGCPILINTSLNPRGVPILSRLEATREYARATHELGVRVFHGGRLLAT